jgi:hypothetical protein
VLAPVPLPQVRKLVLQSPRRPSLDVFVPASTAPTAAATTPTCARDRATPLPARSVPPALGRSAGSDPSSSPPPPPRHLVAVFRDPHQVILDVPNRMPARPVFRHHAIVEDRSKLTA